VGIIGFRNVGKYSVIQSCAEKYPSSSEGILLSPDIVLIDTPGTLIASVDFELEHALIRNATNMRFLPKPYVIIKTIVQKCPKDQLLQLYKIPMYNYHIDFLRQIVQKTSKKVLSNDLLNTAEKVYNDWNTGKIPYHTQPPTDTPLDESNQWRDIIKQNQILQIEKTNVIEKLTTNLQKIMFSALMEPMNVIIDPSWLNINRTPEDPLQDIKEEVRRRTQKKAQRKKKSRLLKNSQPHN